MNNNIKAIISKALSRVPLFEVLPQPTLERIAQLARIEQVKGREVIFREGEGGDRVYIIVSGTVKICSKGGSGEEVILKKIGAGEVFGEMSLLDGLTRSADAVTLEDTVLFYINRKQFLDFLRAEPEVAIKLLETLSLKLRQTNEMAINLLKDNNGAVPPETPAAATLSAPDSPGEVILPGEAMDTASGAENSPADGERQKEWLYVKNFTCPLCAKESSSQVSRSKHVQVEKMDSDMCSYYRKINPTFYNVVVCAHCGYAFTEDSPRRMRPEVAAQLKERMPSLRMKHDFSGIRDMDQAINTYRLAITCQTLSNAKDSLLGRLFMRLGCLYRQRGMAREEEQCLEQALVYMEKAFANERSDDPRNELNLIYLIGELKGRLGNYKEAVQWFSKVTGHPDRHTNSFIVNLARDRWQEMRQLKSAENK